MKRARPLLGTLVEIEVQGASEALMNQAINAAFRCIQQVQALMSAHDASSQLSRLNRHAFLRPVRVHPSLYKVLQTAGELNIATKGRFDCTIAPQLMQSGHLNYRVGCASLVGTAADIQLMRNFRVRFNKRLAIDLGGIAKGYAVDKAVTLLKYYGMATGVVNAGGDIRVFGASTQSIYVRNPASPSELIALGTLKNGAIATSATYFSADIFPRNIFASSPAAQHQANGPVKPEAKASNAKVRQSKYTQTSALINPKSRRALVSKKSYSVIASSCMVADALTKAMAFSKQAKPNFLRKYQAHAAVFS